MYVIVYFILLAFLKAFRNAQKSMLQVHQRSQINLLFYCFWKLKQTYETISPLVLVYFNVVKAVERLYCVI